MSHQNFKNYKINKGYLYHLYRYSKYSLCIYTTLKDNMLILIDVKISFCIYPIPYFNPFFPIKNYLTEHLSSAFALLVSVKISVF